MPEAIPRKMKAAVLHGWNDLRYEEIETPQVRPEEVLCRVGACGICGTDIHIMQGHFKGVFPPQFPFILGHEWYGEIAALGPGVEGFAVGQRVIGEPQKGCRVCPRCLEGRYHLCVNAPHPRRGYKLYGHNAPGAYAEYVAVDGTTIHPMPDGLGVEEGVSACNVGIGIEAIRRAQIDIGDCVAVIGVGLLGLIILQLARISGAVKTIAVGRGHRLETAGRLGADEKVDRTRGDVVERVKKLTNGAGADVVVECAGAEEAVQQALACVRRGGRVVIAGISGGKHVSLDTDRIALDELDVIGTRGAPNALTESINLLASGRITVKPLVTHQLPLSEVQKGMEIFSKRLENVIRVALIP